jgi:two-component system chemotaxis response regulator CheY
VEKVFRSATLAYDLGHSVDRILLVEDSAAMRAYVRATLEADGAREVTEATSGLEALRLLPHGPFAVVITDVNMPDLSGLELVAFIRRSQHRSTPIVIISTEGREVDRERALALGANAYLTKPFSPEKLAGVVAPFLSPAGR